MPVNMSLHIVISFIADGEKFITDGENTEDFLSVNAYLEMVSPR